MPKTLVRYSQVRRLGTPNVQETDSAFAEGRYFEANCLAGDLVNQFVRVVSNTLSVPDVTKVDPSDASKMPAVGVIVQKPTATTCLVQVSGQITSFSPVVAGAWYYVGMTTYPVTVAPALPAIQQVIGVGLDAARLLLRPGFGTEPLSAVGPFRIGLDLLGPTDGLNRVFTTPAKFVHVVGQQTIEVFHNGRRLRQALIEDPGLGDYFVFEGGGFGTGFDSIKTLTFTPSAISKLVANFVAA